MAVPFITEHFEALNRFANGYLLHVEVQMRPGRFLSFQHERLSGNEESFVVQTSIKVFRIVELISLALLLYAIFKHGVKRYDIVNFHVGYPNLVYHGLLKKLIRKPFLIIEHWTAFHYEFNMPKGTRKLDRIRHIYRQQFPLVVVSRRLGLDIEGFAGCKQRLRVIPNVVDSSVFYFDPNVPVSEKSFFMVNYWRKIKNPFPVLEAFTRYVATCPEAQLRVGGYGPLWNDMVRYVAENGLESNVKLLGRLTKNEIADELRGATALVHHADYETFSVVCAEAISCGCPVIVNYLEAVAEFIDDSNGVFVKSGQSFLNALIEFDPSSFDRAEIARTANARFSREEVGRQLFEYNSEILAAAKEGHKREI